MRLLIYFLIAILLSGSVYAKTLQGDGVNGVITRENFLKQGDAEIVVSGVRTYNNGDLAEPTTCTGGGTVTGLTVAREKSDDMGGSFYWKITKSAGTQRGKGVAFDFTIDKFTSREQIEQELYTRVSTLTGTFVTGDASDVKLFIYDRDAAAKVNVRGGNAILGPEVLRWYNPKSGSRNFTACLHVATTSASAYTLGVKNLMTGVAKPESRGDVNNTFTAHVTPPSTIDRKTGPDHFTGIVTVVGNLVIIQLKGLNHVPNCTISSVGVDNANVPSLKIVSDETTKDKIAVIGYVNNSISAHGFTISCTRTGSDYVPDAVLADQYGTTPILTKGSMSGTLTNSGYQKITITPSAPYDNRGWNNSEYTVQRDGIYRFYYNIVMDATGSPNVTQIRPTINGAFFLDNYEPTNSNYTTSVGVATLHLKKGAVIAVTGRMGSGSLGIISDGSSVQIFEENSSQSLFRPDTFYPSDVVNTETQVGWDRTVTPNKPIYKRCHKVESDISDNTTPVLASWGPNLKPINLVPDVRDNLQWSIMSDSSSANRVGVSYSPASGNVISWITGTGTIKAGTIICMEYVRP